MKVSNKFTSFFIRNKKKRYQKIHHCASNLELFCTYARVEILKTYRGDFLLCNIIAYNLLEK